MSISRFFDCHPFHRFVYPGHKRFFGIGHHAEHRPDYGYRGHEFRHPLMSRGNHHRGWLF